MKISDIFKSKKKAPKWDELSNNQKQLVASRVAKKLKAMAGARYRIVTGLDQNQREQGLIECLNEDQILNQYRRGRMLDMTRNLVRNSSTFNTILKQFDFNVVGTNGGKVIINFDDTELNHELRDLFAEFTRNADFFDGMSFNAILKLILKEYLIGGDCCIIFDDGLIENSGKILVYESDEIGNTTQEAIEKHYGKGATQSLGKVYSKNGRWIGSIVSRSSRGASSFDPDKCYFLKRNPDDSNFNSFWMQPQNIWRSGQGRGTTQAAASIGTIVDLEDLQNFELQASKMNAQSFCQIYNTASKKQLDQMPSAFDVNTDFSQMTDAEIEAAAKIEAETQEEVISFDRAASCGILYQQMPEDWKMEILDTKHVNPNTQEFIKWLAGRSSSVFGLSEVFATLMPDGASFRAQQLLTQPCFEECKKNLIEPICDWVFHRFVQWLDHNGKFDARRLPKNWISYISWQFPHLDDLDPVASQNAINLKLKNMTSNYHEILGNDWKEKLMQTASEIKWLKENNLPIPQYSLISGGQGVGADGETLVTESDEGKDLTR